MGTSKKKIFIHSLLFSVAFALLFKWWEMGNPFHLSTLFFGLLMFIIVFVSQLIWFACFQKRTEVPVGKLKKRLPFLFALYLIVVLIISFIIVGIYTYVFRLILDMDTSNFWDFLFHVEFPALIKSYLVIIFIPSAIFFYINWSKTVDREQQLREENLIYRYRTLKAQVNPHFLFNSLNVLSEIIYTDTRKADEYIHELAGVYRYILDNEETDLISLEEEVNFISHYFELQKVRDGERIRLDIDIPHPEHYRIIPISLQILVENALKHNSASEEVPLIISIKQIDAEFIMVSNPIRKRTTLSDSHGTGLANLKERVRLIMGREMIVETENNIFTVKLPISNCKDESTDHRR